MAPRRAALALGLVLILAAPAPASAAPEPVEVDAAGNIFTGGLAFEPDAVEAAVGQTVRWTNTDFLVPHTATEDHELWDLTGDYGQTPVSPPGFGPGDSRERSFEAGSWSYFCRVHPVEMRGTVEVPVALRTRRAKARGKGKRFHVIARWSQAQLPDGQVFDVQKRALIARASTGRIRAARSPLGAWKTVREDSRALKLRTRPLQAGSVIQFRARVHRADDPTAASGFSPRARIIVG